VEIVRHSKHEAVRFDQQWRNALRSPVRQGRQIELADLAAWQELARLDLSFAHDYGTDSGTIVFQDSEPIPHPSELCEQLNLDSVWIFADGFRWAVHTEHEGWEHAEVFELPESCGSDADG
jgi:hypothetical protein